MTDQEINNLTRQLYPTGRAWWMRRNGMFNRLLRGLVVSETEMINQAKGLLNSILPDNDYFSETDATRWERALAIFGSSGLTLSERKLIIEDKIKYPGDIPARQHWLYLEGRLQNVGFSVYVHENPSGIVLQDALYGNVKYGEMLYGQTTAYSGEILANYIDSSKDSDYIIGGQNNMYSVFFVGGATFPATANVPLSRKDEFRELILKIKPAQTIALLLINYV